MKGERNAQVYQVGPHLFGTSSTIPHWKTEELIPSLKPFLLSLDTYKEKELKIAFSLAIQPESETQEEDHAKSLTHRVRMGKCHVQDQRDPGYGLLSHYYPRSQRSKRVHSLFLLRIYQRYPFPARNRSGCICAQQYPNDDLCFQYSLFRYCINARFRHKERWKGISLPRQKRNGKEYAQRVVAKTYPRL